MAHRFSHQFSRFENVIERPLAMERLVPTGFVLVAAAVSAPVAAMQQQLFQLAYARACEVTRVPKHYRSFLASLN